MKNVSSSFLIILSDLNIALISALEVLLETPRGKDQTEKANFILASVKGQELPKAVLDALKSVVT